MHRFKHTCAAAISFAALGIGCCSALAVEPDTMFPALEACTEAALQKQEGTVLRWELTSDRDPYSFEIDVLAPNDFRWVMKCTEGAVGTPVRKVGNKDYKKFTSRVKVPEKSARFTAVGAFPHVAQISKMQLDLSGFKGIPYYTYELSTSDGRTAVVDVNAATGEIDRTESQRK